MLRAFFIDRSARAESITHTGGKPETDGASPAEGSAAPTSPTWHKCGRVTFALALVAVGSVALGGRAVGQQKPKAPAAAQRAPTPAAATPAPAAAPAATAAPVTPEKAN